MNPPPQIRCTRCDSDVSWAPFCDRCGAYLEFVGEPPWSPRAPEPLPGEEQVTQEIVLRETVVEETVVEETVVEETVDTSDFEHFFPDAPPEDSTAKSPSSRGTVALIVGALLLAVLGGGGLAVLTNGWIGAMFVAVCATWAYALWPRRTSEPVDIPASVTTRIAEVIEEEVTITVGDVAVSDPLAATIEAREPQYVPTRAVEVPVSVHTAGPQGEVPCPACGELNVPGRTYCQWCGAVMPGTQVAPSTIPYLEQLLDENHPADSRGRTPRLSRSWRVPLFVGTLAFVFLSAVVLAVFGPFAFQFRAGTTQIFQAINQFIDPYAGNQTDVASATATSTLPGTSPREGTGNDGATFWASQTQPDFGAGESLTMIFDQPYTIDRVVVLPGIQNGLFDHNALASPATVTLTFDDGTSVTEVLDRVQSQRDLRQLIHVPRTTTQSVTMRIDTVYPPRVLPAVPLGQVAVSGFYALEPPQPPAFIQVPTEIRNPPALPGTTS